jgi:osmoprotectant transport system permease protein
MPHSKNNLSVLGAAVTILSVLFMSFAAYRPNRVQSGAEISARELFGNNFYVLLTVALVLLAFVYLSKKNKQFTIASGVLAVFFVFLLVLLLGSAAAGPAFTATPNGRLSIGSGFWLSLIGVLMVISGNFNGYKKTNTIKRLLYLSVFLVILIFLTSGYLNELSIMKEFFNRKETFFEQIGRHFVLAFSSVILGIITGIPVGIFIYKSKKPHNAILFLINLGQTIPTLSLLGLIMVLLAFASEKSGLLNSLGIKGIGFAPAFIVLVIYALFPIVHNTISGLKMVDEDVIQAARGMGMKSGQTLRKVELPSSLPVLLGGIRTALTQSIGNTILAGLIGGGGLGSIIFLGLSQAAPDLILLGVIPLLAVAFLLDSMLAFIVFFTGKKYLGVAV